MIRERGMRIPHATLSNDLGVVGPLRRVIRRRRRRTPTCRSRVHRGSAARSRAPRPTVRPSTRSTRTARARARKWVARRLLERGTVIGKDRSMPPRGRRYEDPGPIGHEEALAVFACDDGDSSPRPSSGWLYTIPTASGSRLNDGGWLCIPTLPSEGLPASVWATSLAASAEFALSPGQSSALGDRPEVHNRLEVLGRPGAERHSMSAAHRRAPVLVENVRACWRLSPSR